MCELHLIRHVADVPVLLFAMASKPDWLLTHNKKHLTQTVAQRTSLRITTRQSSSGRFRRFFGKGLVLFQVACDASLSLRTLTTESQTSRSTNPGS